jgi:hypothetical protein
MWRQILLDQGYPFEDPQVLALLQQCGGPDARILRQMEVGCCKVCEDYMRREYEKVQGKGQRVRACETENELIGYSDRKTQVDD